ncbi:hypothetical protein S40285_06176 [Stachybotrys chlorohalonatus IBT 40285]|uniref:Something about silencing protein 4 domain-containing protein n=1 Tax=Stachybotrys chlorohalonatus (strain IBT 40285) TaxID=1283841 RepID=A0A084QA68_STAC4|nr:hypothetical protein S40285_06176 [Stachybotrys chlorohalonata IBT 40285]
MASVTRSTRRAEGLHPHHVNANHSSKTRPSPGLFHHDHRMKRALDIAEPDFESYQPKRTRIAVEILARPTLTPSESSSLHMRRVVTPHAPQLPALATTPTPTPTPAPAPLQPPPRTAVPQQDNSLTKHQAKVINGIKHELDRLQPQTTDTKEQGRKLRSQEATRFKSELSAYFPDYDEVIGNEPKELHLFNIDTPVVVVDSKPQHNASAPPSSLSAGRISQQPGPNNEYPIRGYGDALFTDLCDSQIIDFGFLEAQYKNTTLGDPLPDALFEPVHKRAERVERSIRNTEKGRAQHERDQIVRLLEGLQGHDWLRVMGVSGVTETKKKTFEPARDHFIKGCQAILNKFRNWSLEEKRRKLEKEKARAERAESTSEEDDDSHDDEINDETGANRDEEHGHEEGPSRDDTSDASSPAKQLREEAMARSKLAPKTSKKKTTAPRPAQPKPPEPPREFKSFFNKKHEREGSLNRHRRAGRKVLAWGHPIPDITQMDFELPEEYRDGELMKARERQKRRERRSHKP